MNVEQFMAALEDEFHKQIQAKNSWGKNELMLAFEKAKVAALLRFL
jgi:hypothetical protein